jgi:hypothetical protein
MGLKITHNKICRCVKYEFLSTDCSLSLFSWYWGLNLGLHTCKANALLLESHPQLFLLSLLCRQDLTFCPGRPGSRSFYFKHPAFTGMTGACTAMPSFFPLRCTDWPGPMILLISASRGAEMTGVSHGAQLDLVFNIESPLTEAENECSHVQTEQSDSVVLT